MDSLHAYRITFFTKFAELWLRRTGDQRNRVPFEAIAEKYEAWCIEHGVPMMESNALSSIIDVWSPGCRLRGRQGLQICGVRLEWDQNDYTKASDETPRVEPKNPYDL